MKQKTKSIRIASLPEPMDAHILRGLLEKEGIEVLMFGEYSEPFVKVHVPIEKVDEANEIVELFYANYIEKKPSKQNCFTPYRKYVISALSFPILGLITFVIMGQFDNIKFLFPVLIFFTLLVFPILILLPNFIACPKCEQKIGCNKKNCIDWFGLDRLSGIFNSHCKNCGYDLNQCEEKK